MHNCGLTEVNWMLKRNLSASPAPREQAAQACQKQLDTTHSANDAV